MEASLEHLRHTLAHLLAAAVLRHYPDAKPTIGPSIENGFYYDFDFPAPISSDDLKKIEDTMRVLLKTWSTASGREVTESEAKGIFSHNQYKQELIDDIVQKGETITLYTWGAFEDLCRGGHIESAKEIDPRSFTLTHLAGAYWRGSEKNSMLTRIYGAAFATADELAAYLKMMAEAEKRDHRKLGRELELFTIVDDVGPGLPLFYPKGAILRRLVEEYIISEQEKRGYVPIWIPHITRESLYQTSGHLAKYDAMYPPMLVDDEHYYLKPMNCPHFMMLYKSLPHSYRDLPLRYTSTTTVYRHEKSGELSGLTRVRTITQDDCHVFCTEEQIEAEIELMLEMITEVYRVFAIAHFRVTISVHDPAQRDNYIGSDEYWTTAENSLKKVVEAKGVPSEIAVGEAAFYGPKLDFMVKDAIGREWQLSTIQLDYNLPCRFGLEYTTSEGGKQQPIVIHRAILGSTERFLGVMIEHFAGAFPLWLSPVQVMILPVGEAHHDASQKLATHMQNEGIRAEVDCSNDTVGKKIRNAEKQKTPYMLVIGDKEKDSVELAVRKRGSKDMSASTVDGFVSQLHALIQTRSQEL